MRWCRGDIRRQIEFFDPSVTIAPRALISPPFRGGSCPKSVTHVSLLICHPCPPTIPANSEYKMVNMRIVSILLIALLGASACRVESLLWPTTGWKTSIATDQGVDQAELQKLDNEFARGDYGYVDGFLLIRHGYVVHEKSYEHDYKGLFSSAPNKTPGPYNYYDFNWHPFYQGGRLHTMQSISKSVTSALIGIAIQRGEIPGVETNSLSY